TWRASDTNTGERIDDFTHHALGRWMLCRKAGFQQCRLLGNLDRGGTVDVTTGLIGIEIVDRLHFSFQVLDHSAGFRVEISGSDLVLKLIQQQPDILNAHRSNAPGMQICTTYYEKPPRSDAIY